MSLLPPTDTPRIVHRAQLTERSAATLDAVLVVIPEDADPKLFASLPESERWRGLHAQSSPRAGTARSTVLANSKQTLAVLGYLRKNASAFERLALAGSMLKVAGKWPCETLAVTALGLGAAGVEMLDALASAALAHAFALPTFQSKPSQQKLSSPKNTAKKKADPKLTVIEVIGADTPDLRHIEAAARGNNTVRWLTALPPNKLDAKTYRRVIGELAETHGLSMKWIDEGALKRLGAGAFLAVSQGNADRNAGIAHLKYRPPRNTARAPDLALVGKGILFDTGGTNLKPHRSMLDMHMDMSGSAVALATLIALAELKAPIAVDAWLAITENRIGPSAYKPQDVVTAANGVTIQVIHTDAEGRMVLADTLALAGRTNPRMIIDYATLTGTCVYALTERMSGVLSNRPKLGDRLVEAGRTSGERVWNFPLEPDYDTDIESKVADVLQCALEGKGDHIIAARFLNRFVPETSAWAHVDLSSVARPGGLGHINTDITGFGVRFTLELLLKHQVLKDLERLA